MKKPWYQAAFESLYPIVYKHRDDAEAKQAVVSFVEDFDKDGLVLDLACGAGRHLHELVDHSLNAFGVDLSGFLLSEAKGKQSLGGRLIQTDMRWLPFRDASFSTVMNMFTSFGYFTEHSENQGVFDEVARIVGSGGLFVFDYLNVNLVAEAEGERTRETDGYRIAEVKTRSDDGSVVRKRVRITPLHGGEVVEYEETLRLYDDTELTAMLVKSGFTIHASYGDYDKSPFAPARSPRLIILGVKS